MYVTFLFAGLILVTSPVWRRISALAVDKLTHRQVHSRFSGGPVIRSDGALRCWIGRETGNFNGLAPPSGQMRNRVRGGQFEATGQFGY